MLDLRAIDGFGGIDADADDLLERCFQDHPAYLDALNHQRFLIIGRKGSGKTAIYRRLIRKRAHDHFAYGYTFDDYPWQHHDLQAQEGVPEERRYIHSWKYLVLMGLAKILLNRDESLVLANDEIIDAVARLESFVVDSYGSRDPDLTQLFSPAKELKLKAGLNTKLIQITGERISIESLPAHIQAVNRQMAEDVIMALNPEANYYICFDQLDLGFNPENPKYSQRLVGLLLAARDLWQQAKQAGKNLSVVTFLRDDIYQMLQFEDKNKLTENYTSRIDWDAPSDELTLRQLMESRFGEVIDGADSKPWDEVFDENKEMPGRQTKYAYICDRTFLRPRDMIKFTNEILESAKREIDPVEKFRNRHLHSARERYSEYLLNELEDEIHKHVPSYRDYLEVIKSIGSSGFSREQFEDAWRERQSTVPDDVEPVEALRELFEFSVIAYLKTGGLGGGSKYTWRYKDPRARFNESADVFRVHFGFKEALDLALRTAD